MSLSNTQLEQYLQDGYLVVPDLFTDEELDPVLDAIAQKVEALAARLLASGFIDDAYEQEDVFHRLTKLEAAFPGAATLIHTGGVLLPEIAAIWGSKKLLDIIEQILGPEIAGHPVWNLRAKTPSNPLATVPWHQDTAYLFAGAERTFQPTAWIPLLDANGENGTLEVIRGGHRSGKVFRHLLENSRGHEDSWYLFIPDEALPEGEHIRCDVPKGSVLLLNNLIPHRSTENYSDVIRWSIDLRWQRPAEPSGMDAVKPCILMRTAHDPDYAIEWEEWGRRSRQVGIRDVLNSEEAVVRKEDTKIRGPWMDRWQKTVGSDGDPAPVYAPRTLDAE